MTGDTNMGPNTIDRVLADIDTVIKTSRDGMICAREVRSWIKAAIGEPVSLRIARCVLRACAEWEQSRGIGDKWEAILEKKLKAAGVDSGLLRVVNLATHWSND